MSVTIKALFQRQTINVKKITKNINYLPLKKKGNSLKEAIAKIKTSNVEILFKRGSTCTLNADIHSEVNNKIQMHNFKKKQIQVWFF